MKQDVLAARQHVGARSGLLSAFVLAAGILLTSATQLRSSTVPVGPGELLLLLWALSETYRVLRRGDIRSDVAFRAFALFWGASGVLIPLGWLVALHDANLPVWEREVNKSAQAFVFTGVLTCIIANRCVDERWYLGAARYYVIAAGLSFSGLLALGHVVPRVAGIELWFWERFQGWAVNPNQLGLFCLIVPFFACDAWPRDENRLRRVGYVLAALACILVGHTTDSDGTLISWFVAAGAMMTLHWVQHWGKGRSSWFAVLMYDVMVPVTLLVFGWWLIGALQDDVWRPIVEMYDRGGQGDYRVRAWLGALQAISTSFPSLFFGLGPGPHSDIGTRLIEAHNSYIDWPATTGVIGLLSFLFMLVWLVLRTIKADRLSLFGLMIALMVYSLAHFTIRQLIFWFALVLVANLTAIPGRRAPR